MATIRRRGGARLVMLSALGALALSYLGMWIHNAREFPGMGLDAPEMWGPLTVTAVLAALWLVRPGRMASLLTAVWGWFNLVGGAILSVLPFPILPFEPEQSVAHYVSHLIFGLAQLPLLVIAHRTSARASGR